MQAIKLQALISPDHKIVVQLPADVTAESAAVIVLIETPAASSVGRSLEAYFTERDGVVRPRLSGQEVDQWIDSERYAWE